MPAQCCAFTLFDVDRTVSADEELRWTDCGCCFIFMDATGHQKLFKYPMLFLGDVVAFVLGFAVAGKMSQTSSLSVIAIAAPIFAAWLLISPLMGAFGTKSPNMAVRTMLAWVVAFPAGCALRQRSVSSYEFVVVSVILTGALLAIWRVVPLWRVVHWESKKSISSDGGEQLVSVKGEH